MQLEDYFNFLRPDDIRLKGSRIGIETILYEYLFRARTPEEIANIYTSLTLEQVWSLPNDFLLYPRKSAAETRFCC